jgi:MFS family permease
VLRRMPAEPPAAPLAEVPEDALPKAAARLNPNVRLILIYVSLLSIYSSLVSQTPLAVYIQLIRGDNLSVGIASGIQGVVSLLVAFPAGALSDRVGRQGLLRVAAVIGVLAAVYTSAVLLYTAYTGYPSPEAEGRRYGALPDLTSPELYYMLCGSSALWGLFMGLHAAPLEALFADSVASGSRSKVYVWRSALRTLGNAAGPLISVVIFLVYGDQWRLDELT